MYKNHHPKYHIERPWMHNGLLDGEIPATSSTLDSIKETEFCRCNPHAVPNRFPKLITENPSTAERTVKMRAKIPQGLEFLSFHKQLIELCQRIPPAKKMTAPVTESDQNAKQGRMVLMVEFVLPSKSVSVDLGFIASLIFGSALICNRAPVKASGS